MARGIIDVHPDPVAAPVVTLTAARLKQVLGTDIPMSQAKDVLHSLGFERCEAGGPDTSISVSSPYWRSDVAIEDDLVEEVARVIGYDEMSTTMLSAPIPHRQPQQAWDLKERVRDMLAAAGMREVINYNVVSEDRLRAVDAWIDDALALANPMNEEQRYLRTSLRASILQTVSENRRVGGGEGLRPFELGRVFLPSRSDDDNGLPDERETLVAAFSGRRSPHSWHEADGANNMDFFDAKGVVEDLLGRLGIEASFEPVADPALRPGRTAAVLANGERLGTVGEIADGVLTQFDLDGVVVALAEIDVAGLLAVAPSDDRRYLPFSRYPESVRDLALTVDQAVSAEDIRAVLTRHKLVKQARAQDVYTGEGIPRDKKSIAFGLVFQSDKGTLTAEQIDRVLEDLLRRLQRLVGAMPRR